MSDAVKVAGIITSGFVCAILAIAGEIEGSQILLNLAYAFGGVFGLFFPLPAIGSGVKKLLAK